MKGHDKVIVHLNAVLKNELTAINQYFLHSRMLKDWGLHRLAAHEYEESIDEMKHAEKLIGRIIFLEGKPIVSNLNKINIGQDVESQFKNDWASEKEAIESYNDGIKIATENGDNETRELMEEILEDEENHIDWIESQLDQIKQMGIQNYLVEQIG